MDPTNSTQPTVFYRNQYYCTQTIEDEKIINTRNELAKTIGDYVSQLSPGGNLEITADFSHPKEGFQKHVVRILVFLDRENSEYKKVHLNLGEKIQEICIPHPNYDDKYVKPYAKVPEKYYRQRLDNNPIYQGDGSASMIDFDNNRYDEEKRVDFGGKSLYTDCSSDDILANKHFSKYGLWQPINSFAECSYRYNIFPNTKLEVNQMPYHKAKEYYVKYLMCFGKKDPKSVDMDTSRSNIENRIGVKNADNLFKIIEEKYMTDFHYYKNVKKFINNKLENPDKIDLVMPEVSDIFESSQPSSQSPLQNVDSQNDYHIEEISSNEEPGSSRSCIVS